MTYSVSFVKIWLDAVAKGSDAAGSLD